MWLYQVRSGEIHMRPWYEMVLLTACWVVPILFLFEWITRGLFFENSAESLAESSFFVRRSAAGLVFIEVCLWGPRMSLASFRRARAVRSCRGYDHQFAAGMLAKLLRDEGGMPTTQVMDATNDTAVASLAYLSFHDWIDIARDGDRVWILSEARGILKSATRRPKA